MGTSASFAALRLALPCLPISSSYSSLHNLKLSSLNLISSSSSSLSTLKATPQRLFCSSSIEVIEVESSPSSSSEASNEEVVTTEEQLPRLPSPKLSVKERKELASYAHSLGKKLKSQQVGKSGVTPSVAASFVENLESNELLKLKIHGNCPGELLDVIKQLESSTGSIAVDQIGRSVILYRPSLSKMKKREAASLLKAKEYSTFKMQRKGQSPRVS